MSLSLPLFISLRPSILVIPTPFSLRYIYTCVYVYIGIYTITKADVSCTRLILSIPHSESRAAKPEHLDRKYMYEARAHSRGNHVLPYFMETHRITSHQSVRYWAAIAKSSIFLSVSSSVFFLHFFPFVVFQPPKIFLLPRANTTKHWFVNVTSALERKGIPRGWYLLLPPGVFDANEFERLWKIGSLENVNWEITFLFFSLTAIRVFQWWNKKYFLTYRQSVFSLIRVLRKLI